MNSNSGCYVVAFRLNAPTKLVAGRLGPLSLLPGFYAYAGSARRGLRARVDRHRRGDKKDRWHVDYLSRKGELERSWLFHTDRDLECSIARLLAQSCQSSVEGFGSSDCLCESHLFYFSTLEQIDTLCGRFAVSEQQVRLVVE